MPKVGMARIRRQQLIDAFVRIVGSEGWEGLTIRRVSEEAGVSTGIVAHYFGDKQSLVAQAIERAYQSFLDDVFQAVHAQQTARGKLLALLRGMVPPAGKPTPGWNFWIAVWGRAPFDPSIRQVLQQVYANYMDLLVDIVQLGMQSGEFRPTVDARTAALRYIALLDGLAIHSKLDPALTPVAVRRHLAAYWSQVLQVELSPEEWDIETPASGDRPSSQSGRR